MFSRAHIHRRCVDGVGKCVWGGLPTLYRLRNQRLKCEVALTGTSKKEYSFVTVSSAMVPRAFALCPTERLPVARQTLVQGCGKLVRATSRARWCLKRVQREASYAFLSRHTLSGDVGTALSAATLGRQGISVFCGGRVV